MKNHAFWGLVLASALICGTHSGSAQEFKTVGSIERLDPRLDALIDPNAPIEVLAEGFEWSEGPVWISEEGCVLFSDIPNNAIMRWHPEDGLTTFLKPAGYTGSAARGGEPGTNGLTLDDQGRLVMCEHGDRRVTRLEADGSKTVLVDRYQGKRFNSPNDLVFKSNGDLYFTDPPYGLVGNMLDPTKELPFQGVFRVTTDGEVTALASQTRPNGIAFSPDESTLYVANSDPGKLVWYAYDVQNDGTLADCRVFFDGTALSKAGRPGGADGLKLDRQSNLWATGPGGVLILAPDGTHLGSILTGQRTANCCWGEDGSTLFITADMLLLRVRTKAQGDRFPLGSADAE